MCCRPHSRQYLYKLGALGRCSTAQSPDSSCCSRLRPESTQLHGVSNHSISTQRRAAAGGGEFRRRESIEGISKAYKGVG